MWMYPNSFYHSLMVRHLGYFTMLHNDMMLAYNVCQNFWSQRKEAYPRHLRYVCSHRENHHLWTGETGGSSQDDVLVKVWRCSFLLWTNCLKGMVSALWICFLRTYFLTLVIWDLLPSYRNSSPQSHLLIYWYETNYPRPGGLKQQ